MRYRKKEFGVESGKGVRYLMHAGDHGRGGGGGEGGEGGEGGLAVTDYWTLRRAPETPWISLHTRLVHRLRLFCRLAPCRQALRSTIAIHQVTCLREQRGTLGSKLAALPALGTTLQKVARARPRILILFFCNAATP